MSNLEKIQELYGAFGRGEIEPVLAALASDVEWVEGDIEGLPYRGFHHGPEAVGRDVFAQIPGAYESFELSRRSGSTAATNSVHRSAASDRGIEPASAARRVGPRSGGHESFSRRAAAEGS